MFDRLILTQWYIFRFVITQYSRRYKHLEGFCSKSVQSFHQFYYRDNDDVSYNPDYLTIHVLCLCKVDLVCLISVEKLKAVLNEVRIFYNITKFLLIHKFTVINFILIIHNINNIHLENLSNLAKCTRRLGSINGNFSIYFNSNPTVNGKLYYWF